MINQLLNHTYLITLLVNDWKTICEYPLIAIKNRFLKSLIGYFSTTESQLLHGMVFGGSGEDETELNHSLKVIGMQHVTSASGFNVGLMVSLGSMVTTRFERFYELVILCGVVTVYALMADLTPSIIRASTMAIISLLNRQLLLRQYSPLRALGLVTLVGALSDWTTISSISYQLSAAACVGIIFFTSLANNKNEVSAQWYTALSTGQTLSPSLLSTSSYLRSIFSEAFVTTCAAQMLTLPIVLYHFGELSTLSLVSNTVLLWLTPLLTIGGLVFMLLSFINFVPIVEIICHWLVFIPLWLGLQLFIGGATWLGRYEGSLWIINGFGIWHFLAWYIICGLGYCYYRGRQRRRARLSLFDV
ncbi:MAG TPA: ComEC/Rec2 family competence protein [Vitreimonas sp.]|nr:ComEC/Rec2 family competence protein [Vitreimonas sp.]